MLRIAPASTARSARPRSGRPLVAAGLALTIGLTLASSATGAPVQGPEGDPPAKQSCRDPKVPHWFHRSVVRAIQVDDGAHGGGATSSPIPSAWRRSPYLARIVCRQGAFDERFRARSWHGMYAMTKGEIHGIMPEYSCVFVRPNCPRSVARVHQQIAGLRWIWSLYARPKAAWRHILRTGRFNSYPRRGTNDRATKHPFRRCPVDGPIYYNDDFGEFRNVGGYHPHSGNDLSAPTGRPIRAPFNGLAVAHADNWFAGRYVLVVGERGYVANVHLSRYGHLGSVKAGTIVGYVGETGDARSPHDHFEWHPWVKPRPLHESPFGFTRVDDAIDPYPFLRDTC